MRLIAVLCLIALLVHPEGPPPAHTGGFGEPTCHFCHFDGELNGGGGHVTLMGLDDLSADQPWLLEVRLSQKDMQRAGFQLAVRFADEERKGAQAGAFESVDERVAVDIENNIQYIHQTEIGANLSVTDLISWQFRWLPPSAGDSVVFHLTANAANGDDSEFGDAIYSLELSLKTGVP